MVSFSLFFTLGAWLLQQQAALPDLRWAGLIIPVLAALRLPQDSDLQRAFRRFFILTLAICSGFFYSAWIAQQRLAVELPEIWQGRDITVIGIVANMPRQHERGLGFQFDVERVVTDNAFVPEKILLSTYNNAVDSNLEMHAGERWQLTVRLKRPHGTSNPHNFDFEAWALERNLRAVGYVHNKGDNFRLDEHVTGFGYAIERIRESVRAHFQQVLGTSPYVGVLSALAIGDQGSIPPAQWQIFTRTGVNHLMSISGLHITMLAGMAYTLIYWLWRRSVYLTLLMPARKAAALAGLLVALAYALLSGYGVPAQRTVYMLGTLTAALWLSRNTAPSQFLAVALMAVILLDPWSVIAAGFWLSFGAVALIFYITANRLGKGHWLLEYGRIQWAMSIGLIPPLLSLFQQVSLVSPIANIVAIPLVSFVVVPLTLLGAIIPAEGIMHLAHHTTSALMYALVWLNSFPVAVWTQHTPPFWFIITGVIGVLWILLPRGIPSRWLGAIFLMPMFMVQPDTPEPGSLRLTIYDVGQGLAVAAQTSNHALLYDSGPVFNSEANSGNRILVPSMQGAGIARLDKLILTHNDSDHTGGAISIMQSMPVAMVSSSLPEDSTLLQQSGQTERCSEGQNWDWDGVHFELLHPALDSYTDEKVGNNDRSCVLRISIGKHSVLLTADIERKSEQRLLELHPEKLASTLLIVPHHGSKTSSTPDFVAAVNPVYAVITSGYRNQFGHPKAEVLRRYHNQGSEILRSDSDGAILVTMDAENLHVEKYRKTHARYWQ